MKKVPLVATTLAGLEPTLAKELEQIGATKIEQLNRALGFCGDTALLYKANLCLRTALRILKPIHQFRAHNEETLYSGVQQVDWSRYLTVHQTLAVESAVRSCYFNHSQYVSLKTKDAIVDQFRNRTGQRPSVDLVCPTIKVHIHLYDDRGTLSLDSSGESLHKRGYRLQMNEASLNEVLAAGMVLISRWDGKQAFVDPMCGSGTLLIEAAMIANKQAPGLLGRSFGFQSWRDFDKGLWQRLVQEAKRAVVHSGTVIQGADILAKNVDIARRNIQRARLTEFIRIEQRSFEKQHPPASSGVLVMNPPYGERMKHYNIAAFYKAVGDRLKKVFPGYDAWVLSGNKEALKHLGLRASRTRTLYNGPLECKFQRYLLYSGSRKQSKQNPHKRKNSKENDS